jgi:hypothetical protein
MIEWINDNQSYQDAQDANHEGSIGHPVYFYYRLSRYDKRNLSSLENKSKAPKRMRELSYSRKLVQRVRELRREDPIAPRSRHPLGADEKSA